MANSASTDLSISLPTYQKCRARLELPVLQNTEVCATFKNHIFVNFAHSDLNAE